MNGEVGTEAPRPRPLSGGLWTLFSWLRREDRASIESVSSVGSDRTVASFAFLGPGHYAQTAPIQLPPQGPPSDTYKKRVRDRNLRWQHDRDITIHRKYGLYGYDAFSLPNSRRSTAPIERGERDRRATSESFHGRVHVPGKRRAPLPPSAPTSLQRRRARKRQAPLPPVLKAIDESVRPDHKTDINHNMSSERDTKLSSDPKTSNKFGKKCKKDMNTQEPKMRHEKSFLKQIFENKKRNSAIDTSTVKLLPNISELDKQAAEIIARYKLKELNSANGNSNDEALPGSSNQTSESWICTRCLRKYNSSVVTCTYCLPLQKNVLEDNCKRNRLSSSFTQTSNVCKVTESLEDKEKLKEMLKEMKHSLNRNSKSETKNDYPTVMETPTLRIGSHVTQHVNETSQNKQTTSSKDPNNTSTSHINKLNNLYTIENVVITKPVVLEHTKENIVIQNDNKEHKNIPVTKNVGILQNNEISKNIPNTENIIEEKNIPAINNTFKNTESSSKISSLINPIYIPKTTSEKDASKINDVKQKVLIVSGPSTSQIKLEGQDTSHLQKVTKSDSEKSERQSTVIVNEQKRTSPLQKKSTEKIHSRSNPPNNVLNKLDEHSRRRELVSQLEKSIANGDEQAAADAAIKLAQLRLTCSVLSFSSHILTEPSTSGVKNTESSTRNEKTKAKSSQVPSDPSTTIVGLALIDSKIKKLNKEVLSGKIDHKNSDDEKKKTHQIIKEIINENTKLKDLRTNLANGTPTSENAKASAIVNTEFTDKMINNNPVISASTSFSNYDDIDGDGVVPILIWVEDKEKTRGPVQLHIKRKATLGDLKLQADNSLGLAVRMQRWIIGKTLCSDNNTPLVSLAGAELKAPFYLCLVECDPKNIDKEKVASKNVGDVYTELVNLEKQAFVTNTEVFECGVCIEECTPGEGVVLRDCVHSFCKGCLSDVVKHSEEPIVTCPATGCLGILQEREIRALVTKEDYEKWLARGLAVAESGTRNAFHCRTRDCTGWALCEPGVRRFPCPVCRHINCVPCEAIHEGQTCEQHRAKLEDATVNVESGQADDGTRALLNSLIARGEALECPECKAIITKKWGCDWVKCSACKTEICWVTRGRRWGPGGRGDTTAGCRCGVDGKKCHPSCSYCH